MFQVAAHSLPELEYLIESKPDCILAAIPHFSIRQNVFLKTEDLPGLKKKLSQKGIRLAVNCLKMLEETDLDSAQALMDVFREADVDEIYIADEGWIELAEQAGMKERLVYQPETLIVNGLDAAFYIQQGLKAVSMAHELTLDELISCAEDCQQMEVLVHGRYSWMYSRRPLVSNYLKVLNKETAQGGKMWLIQEKTREGRMPVLETENGTSVFSDETLCSYDQIRLLQENGISRFRIDCMTEDPQESSRQLQLYRELLNGNTIPEDLKKGSDALYSMKTYTRKEEADDAERKKD